MQRLILKNSQCPGDFIVMSAMVRDLHRTYPGRYETCVATLQEAVFRNNPNHKLFPITPAVREIDARYSNRGSIHNIHHSNEPTPRTHFLWGFIGDINERLNLNVKLTEFRPDLHLTKEEMEVPLIKKPYWVFASGGKNDYTAKWWDPGHWQTTVNLLRNRQLVQVGGGSHVHPPVNGVIDLVKKTSFRELMRLVYHSDGVICIVTCLAHLAAAFNKPCVVVAGGREPNWWEEYTLESRLHNMRFGFPNWKPPENDDFVPHKYLHTIDKLSCCMNKGCWVKKTVSTIPGEKACTQVEQGPTIRLPRCLNMITPETVADAVEGYYRDGAVRETPPVKVFEPPITRTYDRSLFVTIKASSATRLRTLAELSLHKLNGYEVNIVSLGSDDRIQAACAQSDWRCHTVAQDFSDSAVLRLAASHGNVLNVFCKEDGLPSSRDWASKITDKVHGNWHWRPLTPEFAASIAAEKWFKGKPINRVTELSGQFFVLPKALLNEINWNVPLDSAAVLGEYIRQNDIEVARWEDS